MDGRWGWAGGPVPPGLDFLGDIRCGRIVRYCPRVPDLAKEAGVGVPDATSYGCRNAAAITVAFDLKVEVLDEVGEFRRVTSLKGMKCGFEVGGHPIFN